MKSIAFNKKELRLPVALTAFLLVILCLFLFSFSVSSKLVDDIWKQMGITRQQGTQKIKNSFLNNYFDYYGVRNVKNLAANDRAAVAKDLLVYTKKYVNSAPFKSEYEKLRKQAKPVEPTPKNRTKEDIRKEKIAETEKDIKQTEENMKKMDANMQKTMQSVLDMHKKQLKDYQDPNNKLIGIFYQSEKDQEKYEMEQYKTNLKKWETNFPEDMNQLIKMRLQKYLAVAATVDFAAELVEKNGKKRFVNTEYERKNYDWKMIYRAGKEVYGVTKKFADEWLQELQ